MKYLEIPLSMKKGIHRERLMEIIRVMSDPANQPVYIHCALGQDRTGVVVAAYRMDRDGWSFEEAEKEMQSFGFNDAWIHLKKSLKDFAKHNSRGNRQ
jgi:protein tyrosine/serine phosphatase